MGGPRPIEWGRIPGSYAWVFPKEDNLSVGVIAAKGTGEQVRGYLDEFVSRMRLSHVKPTMSSGHLTKCRAAARRCTAAGCWSPATRPGCSTRGPARGSRSRSGRALRPDRPPRKRPGPRTVTKPPSCSPAYADTITGTLAPEMQAGQAFMRAFKRHPLAMHLALILVPQAWDLIRRRHLRAGKHRVHHETPPRPRPPGGVLRLTPEEWAIAIR